MGHARCVISYQTGIAGVEIRHLDGFFDRWTAAPDAAGLLRVLRGSALAVLARDGDDVVGFVNALSDGELAVYLPLLEVRPTYRGRGIGSELVQRVLSHYADAYMIDVVCDSDVAPFYERLGLIRLTGLAHRNRQAPILRQTAS